MYALDTAVLRAVPPRLEAPTVGALTKKITVFRGALKTELINKRFAKATSDFLPRFQSLS
jgi:hypothetical protein